MALLAFPEAQSLDVIGPLEVFSSATRLLAREPGRSAPGYQLELLASSGEGPVRMSCGVALLAQRAPAALRARAGHADRRRRRRHARGGGATRR